MLEQSSGLLMCHTPTCNSETKGDPIIYLRFLEGSGISRSGQNAVERCVRYIRQESSLLQVETFSSHPKTSGFSTGQSRSHIPSGNLWNLA